MKVSIIIPVYNEEKTLLELLEKVRKADSNGLSKEIICVDDCSTDGSRAILEKQHDIKTFFHIHNRGKGAALRTGLEHATGDVILIQDADLEYDPSDYSSLLQPLIDGKSEVVYGSRFQSTEGNLKKSKVVYGIHYLGNAFLTFMTNLLFRSRLTDMETCYKVFTRSALKKIGRLRATRFDFEPEITAKFLKKGFRIYEVPISYFSRDFKEGKKITWRDGVKALWYLLKYRIVD